MYDVKDDTTGTVKGHVLTALEAEALEVRMTEVLANTPKMNNNEASLFSDILGRIDDKRGSNKGPYISLRQWTWLSDVLDKYEPDVRAHFAPAPSYTLDDLMAALDRVAHIRAHLAA